MGFIDKLFGNKKFKNFTDISNLQPTAEIMPEDQYWDLITMSLTSAHESREAQEAYLIRVLGNLSPAEIIGFRLRTDKLLYDTYVPEMWCAGYLMIGGCSDDSFEYFRLWVISKGKEVYYAAKANPDSLSVFENDGYDYDFETFWYVANTAFENKTGKELDEYIDESFTYCEGNYTEMIFNWSEDNPESMRKICPNIFAKFSEDSH